MCKVNGKECFIAYIVVQVSLYPHEIRKNNLGRTSEFAVSAGFPLCYINFSV